jgi:hypothetical protein
MRNERMRNERMRNEACKIHPSLQQSCNQHLEWQQRKWNICKMVINFVSLQVACYVMMIALLVTVLYRDILFLSGILCHKQGEEEGRRRGEEKRRGEERRRGEEEGRRGEGEGEERERVEDRSYDFCYAFFSCIPI